MAKPNDSEAENKSDGLEIISIGSLYSGAWDKKYWSSSRGKDRYPYPVGYHARRAYNGSSYNMEILEGSKGPLFVISCGDGNSCSAQTPDIAWEKFQKKGFSKMSIWHGKRFSCKIDGIEFFGFKNQFVQRLLRELVANINGIAECSTLPSRFCNGASATEHDDYHEGASVHPDLLPCLARVGATGKRSKRQQTCNPKLINNVSLSKRLRPGNPPIAANVSKQRCSLANSPIESDENHGETKLVNSETCASTSGNQLYPQQRHLDRSESTEEGLNWPLSVDDKAVDAPISKESRKIRDVDLYAPDTLDVIEDGQANSLTITRYKSSSVKEEQDVTDAVVCEGSLSSSHQEENTTSNSNASYDKGDSDSPGQDITKSMMGLLLPQAIPLLKKSRRKNKIPTSLLGDLHPSQKFLEENYRTGSHSEVQSPSLEHQVDQSFVHSKSIIPDTFDDMCGDIAPNELMFPSDNAETHKCSSDKDSNKQDLNTDSGKNLRIDLFHHVSEQRPMNKKPQGIDLFLPEVMLGSASPSMKISHKEKEDAGTKTDTAENLKSKPNWDEAVAPCNSTPLPIRNSVQSLLTANITEAGATQFGNPSTTSVSKKVYARKKGLRAASTTQKGDTLCSKKVGNVCGPESTGVTINSSASQIMSSRENADDAGMEGQIRGVSTEKNVLSSNSKLDCSGPILSNTQAVILASECKDSLHSVQFPVEKAQGYCHDRLVEHNNDPVSAHKQEIVSCESGLSDASKLQLNFETKLNRNLEMDNELKGSFRLVGCYFHPSPVSSLLSIVKGTEFYICVVCGHLGDKERTLFLYKLSIEEPRIGHPSFVGHTSVTWPSSIDIFGREILLERCYQLTPDGQRVVLLGSLRTPYCREGRIDCLCPTCSSECLEHNTLKIVQIKAGYVSVLVKVRTIDSLQCLLVCEPNYLVAAGESGRLHLWIMDPTWSTTTEEFVISTKDYISTSIVDLKRIPQCASLVVGHSGFGDFTVWDILRRTFMSRFSSPSTSVHQFFPISLFSWQKEFYGLSYSNMEEYVNKFIDVKKLWSDTTMNHSNMHVEGEDIAVCILMSGSDFDIQHHNSSRNVQINPSGCWRLGLLVKNMLIVGSTLDTRATAACSSFSHGIIGTLDGQVYAWNLLTGSKLGNIHRFKGGSVSCIATDDLNSGIFAVADDTGQLLVYRCLESIANC